MRALTTAILCILSLTACSSTKDGLSYQVPDNICGIPANKRILGDLLHDGDQLRQDTGYFTLEEGQFCHMYVDGNDSVVSDADWNDSGYTLRDYFDLSARNGTRYFAGGKYASWNNGVVTVIRCPGVSEKGDVVTVAVKDIRWNENSQSLLEKLGPPYFDAYKKKLGCPS
ncbi:hypothetical protein AB0K85_30490 [Streptomyces cellulosae]